METPDHSGAAAAPDEDERDPFTLDEEKEADREADGDDLERDENGSLVNPPTLPEYERRLSEAHAGGNDRLIQHVQDEYTEAREAFARASR